MIVPKGQNKYFVKAGLKGIRVIVCVFGYWEKGPVTCVPELYEIFSLFGIIRDGKLKKMVKISVGIQNLDTQW